MRFCKTCGTLYLESLDCCPKCNAKALEEKEQEQAPVADPKTVRRQWTAIIIGVPALIGLYWIIGYVMSLIRR